MKNHNSFADAALRGNIALTFPSSVLNHDFRKSADIASEIIKNEIKFAEGSCLEGNCSVYLLWSEKKHRCILSKIKEYTFKSITCLSDSYTVDSVIYNDELSKMIFFVAFVPVSKESKLEEYLSQTQFAHFKKSQNLSDSICSLIGSQVSRDDANKDTDLDKTGAVICNSKSEIDCCISLDPKGIVIKSFKQILRNLASGAMQIFDSARASMSNQIGFAVHFLKNDDIREKVIEKVGFWFLDHEFKLLYPYFSAKVRYARDYFDNQRKEIALARFKAFAEVLGLSDFDIESVTDNKERMIKGVSDIKFSATFKMGRIIKNDNSDGMNTEPDNLPCTGAFNGVLKKHFLKDVRNRDIQLEKFLTFFNDDSDTQNLHATVIKYKSDVDYGAFFKDEEIRPYMLIHDPLTKEYTNLEYFFAIVSMYSHKVNAEGFEFDYSVAWRNDKVKNFSAKYSRNPVSEIANELSMLLFLDIRYRLERWSPFHYSVYPFFEDVYKIVDYHID